MKILCVLAAYSINSNILTDITVFNGLKKNDYEVDLVLLGSDEVYDDFCTKYKHYFNHIYFIKICRTIKSLNGLLKMPYLLWCNIVGDYFSRPYKRKKLKIHDLSGKEYDFVLALCPPSLTAFFARDLIKKNKLEGIRYIQYWSDPLSIGMCNDVDKLPLKRIFHHWIEKHLLKDADRVVYCYQLLCIMQKRLYPKFADKMFWTDVSYIEREDISTTKEQTDQIKIGLFGAYQKNIRNILPLLEAIKSFPNVTFIIRGDTDICIDPSEYSNLDIEFERKPYNEIQKLENDCDILLSLGSLSGVNTPAGKTFYYANINKPIVYIGDGRHKEFFADYLKELNRYIVCDNNVQSIKNAIREALTVLPTFTLSIPERLKPENVAKRIILTKNDV